MPLLPFSPVRSFPQPITSRYPARAVGTVPAPEGITPLDSATRQTQAQNRPHVADRVKTVRFENASGKMPLVRPIMGSQPPQHTSWPLLAGPDRMLPIRDHVVVNTTPFPQTTIALPSVSYGHPTNARAFLPASASAPAGLPATAPTAVVVVRDTHPSPHKVAQGKRRKLMDPAPWTRFHPFTATLERWADGVPVACGSPWTQQAVTTAVLRGPHTSALTRDARLLITDEMDYQVAAGFSEILSWPAVQALHRPELKVSPLAVIPQVGRRGRLLLDLSFAVQAPRGPGKRARRAYHDSAPPPIAPSVNDTTTKHSPEYPVKETGRVLPRLLHFLATVPAEETIMFAKIDLSDGFWRMLVDDNQKWNFAYVLPGTADSTPSLVIPHALQMGWTESPGYFCATTETGRDIMQALIDKGTVCPPHLMEAHMAPSLPARRQTSPVTPQAWQMSAVYVDDYILAAVEDQTGNLLARIGRAALHSIHGLFPPPEVSGHKGGKDPISTKKLEAGDAQWAPTKEILGFVFDGTTRTVCLTQRKATGIAEATALLLRKNRASLQKFQSVIGKMRHVTTILPAARGLFTPLNRALRGAPVTVALSAKGDVRAALLDLRQLVLRLAARPTHVNEILLPDAPHYIGYCDASAFGAGGVWFSGTEPLPETVWRLQWPRDITAAVISDRNPTGELTNSDLEMAAVVLHLSALETVAPTLRHKHIFVHSDNTPSVAWVTRMATKTATSDAAHRLLRGLAIRQRMLESAPVSIAHVAGVDNTLADFASRPITQLDDDTAFLTHFDSQFPLQNRSWQRASPIPAQLSNVILTLRGQRLTLQRWTSRSEPLTGAGGPPTATNVELIHGSGTFLTRPVANYCWALPPGLVLDTLGKAGRLEPRPWRKPCVTWHKPSCWRDTQTPAEPRDPAAPTWLYPLPTFLNPTRIMTQSHVLKWHCPSTQSNWHPPLALTPLPPPEIAQLPT